MIPKIIQNPMQRFTAAVAVLLSLACAFSCKKEKGGGDTLEKIYFVDPASASMVLSQGQTGYIMYATVPESAAATAVMEWSSSDTNIAEVFNGQVTAIAPGNTVITVKCGNVSATLDVQVVPIPVTSFSVPKTMSAYMDMPTPIKLTVEPAEANAASLEWKSDNPEIAEVVIESGKAFVNAKKEGGCKITVTPYNSSEASQQISVTVYPAIFKLMRRSISGESSYVEILNDDSFDITDIGMPYEGIRCIEMIRLDGDKLLESSVEVNNENSGIVSITKRQRSESKVLLNVEEKSEVGATKVSVSLKEDDNVYTKTFTITRQKHDFTSDTKICRIYTETPVNDVEEMARNATMEVQMFPAVNAVWTSSNESVAKVVPATSDGTGFSPMAEIRTFGEYGSAEITATDESGKNTRKFTVKVSKASFPAGTKICIRVNGKIEPVGESTTIRASYDGRNDEAFGLMDASGNYLSTFTNFKWTIESPSCECSLTPVDASGVVVAPISTTTFSGSKTATLVCTDDAGNQLKHKIIIYSPIAFGRNALGAKVNSEMFYEDAKVDIGNKAVVALYGNKKVPVTLAGVKWSGLEKLNSYGRVNISTNSTNTISYFEFTPNQKMESVTITVEDEIGQEQTLRIQSAAFHFPKGAKLYYSYGNVDPTGGYWAEVLDGMPLKNDAGTYLKIATSAEGKPIVDKAYWDQIWASAIEKSKNHSYIGEFDDIRINVLRPWNIFGVFTKKYPTKYQEPEYYSIEAKDDYGTALSAGFYIREWVKFESEDRFHVQMKKTTTYIKYGDGSAVHDDIPDSQLFSDGSIIVKLNFNGKAYRFSRIIVTNSAKQDHPHEYYLYHVNSVRVYPTSSSPATRLVFSDDFGNMKTITFKLY
jgi:hypothetical protein